MLPFSPTKTTPLCLPGNSLSFISDGGGSILPSYQNILTGGRPSSSGNSHLMICHLGGESTVLPSLKLVTTSGLRRLSAQNAVFIRWHAMSPSAPVPKSHQPRQLNGMYAG